MFISSTNAASASISNWTELFALNEEEPIFQKRILSIVSGAILPIVALGFIKSLVDYIQPEQNISKEDVKEDNKAEVLDKYTKIETINSEEDSKDPKNPIYIPRSLLHTRDVLEKYDDYKYPFSVYGNGLIQFGHYYNDISNIFQQENRYSCGSYGFAAPLEIWKDEQLLRKMNYTFWRLGNKSVGLHNWRGSFRLGAYVATQFKPHVAKTIYDLTKAKSVMDTSCGWGDRLAAFYASNAYEYYGCDPNEKVFETYKNRTNFY
jgi:hypothetical protein